MTTDPSHASAFSVGSGSRSYRRWLACLLIVSYGLRVWLACLGGQGFWADEDRYSDGRAAANYLLHGQWHQAGQEMLGHPDHTGFRWFCVPPGILEVLTGPHPAAVAAYFGLFSVLSLYLIWAVARRSGAGEGEALWAAYLAACANTLFYYSRHFFPYDISLCAMLGALWLGLGRWSWRNSLFVGAAAGFGFLVYNGYWLLGGCVLILHSLLGDGGRGRILARAVWSGTGLILVMLPVVGLGRVLGYDLVSGDYQWGVIARGDFPFGYRVTAGYLWFAEGGLLLIWLAALGYALAGAWRDRRLGRLAWSAGGLALVAGGLIILSDVVPLFTVQGRRVRCLVPFFCLAAALGLNRFLQARGRAQRGWSLAIALVVLVLAAKNFSRPFRQIFPDQFQKLAVQAIDRQPPYLAYRLAFGQSLWGLPLDDVLPAYPPILQRPHPLQFRPYQYEGYDTAQRAEINRHDVAMRLFAIPTDLGDAVRQWDGYPGPLRWSLIFPSNRESLSEPLVTSGRTGRGDFLFVRYVDKHRIAFGLDHWGGGAAISEPLEIDYAKPHEIVLSLGSLLPPAGSDVYKRTPGLLRWRNQALVLLDGVVVFHWTQEAWPADARQIMFGINLLGGGTAQQSFSGQILKLDAAPLDFVRRAMGGPVVGSLLADSWARDRSAAVAPAAAQTDKAGFSQRDVAGRGERIVGVRFRMPAAAEVRPQPLLAFVRKDGVTGLLAMRWVAGNLNIGWRDGDGWWWTQALPAPVSGIHRVVAQWLRLDGPAVGSGGERARHLAAMIGVDGVIYPHPRPLFFDVPLATVVSWRDPGPKDPNGAPSFMGEPESPPVLQALLLAHDGAPPTRRFRLAVSFPTNRAGRSEPLVTAGKTGAADGLFVHYERPGWIRVGADHWGSGGAVSEPVPVVSGAYQVLDVEFGSGGWANPGGGKIQVSLDGRTILSASTDFYPVDPSEVTIGRNPIGFSTSDADFTGIIFPIENADGDR